MSKHESPYLRRTIFLTARCYSFHDNPFNDYNKRKREQGKYHLTAVGYVSHKPITVIYAVLRDTAPYESKKLDALSSFVSKLIPWKNNH